MALIHRKVESFREYPDGSWEAVYGEPEEVPEFDWPEELDIEPAAYRGVPLVWDSPEQKEGEL